MKLDLKTGKVALFFTTRNCYQLFEGIFFENTTQDFSNYYIFNLDLKSTREQMADRDRISERYGIINIPTPEDDPNLYSVERNLELCNEFIEENELDVDWILWCSHDGSLEGDQFLQELEKKIQDNPRFENEVGVIGFCDINTIEMGKPCYGKGSLVEGCGVKERGEGWYQNLPPSYEGADYFIVEGAHDNMVAVNRHLYKKYITPDYNFVLFLVWDDISGMFGLNNIASITIPSLKVIDWYREKPRFGLKRSLDADPSTHIDQYRGNDSSFIKFWLDKWKWSLNSPSARRDFEKVKHLYTDTIHEKLFSWSLDDGPKTLEDL